MHKAARPVTSTPLHLVGSFEDLRDRLVVQVELDRHTGEVMSISGDRDAIRRTCSLLLDAIESTRMRDDEAATDGPRRLSDREVRDQARPENILAALRRDRERRSVTASKDTGTEVHGGLPPVEHRDEPTTTGSPLGDEHGETVTADSSDADMVTTRASNLPWGTERGRSSRDFVEGPTGRLRLVPAPMRAIAT